MTNSPTKTLPYLGFGLRLRKEYIQPVLQQRPDVDWFEIISEGYLDDNGSVLSALDEITESYPVVMHGLSLSIGSPWPLDLEYLERLKQLADRIEPAWISDHLCWSGADDLQGQLLPVPYSIETLEHIVTRVKRTQDLLGRRILLENVPMEQNKAVEIPESEFISEIAEQSDSLILIDISNLHASSVNQGFDPIAYLSSLPEERVQQIHLAGAVALCGNENEEEVVENSIDPVWKLYTAALDRFGPVSTMIEREDTIPCLEGMVSEVQKARCSAKHYLSID